VTGPSTADDEPLPDGTRLLHIGPQKTGTSGLQGAFHAARGRLEAQGVHYAGANRQPRKAAIAAASGEDSERAGNRAARDRHWRALVRDVESTRAGRVVISAEDFADAEPDAIRRIVDGLDRRRVHVVVTLRSLERILPSQWQQLVQGGLSLGYGAWLASVFDRPNSPAARLFWHRHRHDALIDRWAAAVGPANVIAIVADDRRPEAVLRACEQLLGLSGGTLEPVSEGSNRSLTRSEVELVRAAHETFRAAGISSALRLDVLSRGAAASMKLRTPAVEEPRVETPSSLHARVLDAQRAIVDGIAAAGVRVIGDLDALIASPPARRAAARAAADAWPSIEGQAALGVLHETGLTRGKGSLDAWSTSRIASHLVGRLRGIARP
jgi:hypothetical protein